MESGYQLKDYFNASLIARIGTDLCKAWQKFDSERFQESIVPHLEPLSLTERAQFVTEKMAEQLPQSYPDAIEIILASLNPENEAKELTGMDSFYYMPHANYISTYGLEHLDASLLALLEITKRFTSEFPIRAFITAYPEKMMAQLHAWVTHENVHVRRLVSEGTRPRLPWASRLPQFQKDPEPVIALLEKLKQDPELYVRRSVANNLNDIGKDHPERVVALLREWKKVNDEGTQWIIRHASRSLVKAGNPAALELLGYSPTVKVRVQNFEMAPSLKMGETISFAFELVSEEAESADMMIDYTVHFMKANGKQAPKVFKLAKKKLAGGEVLAFAKKQSFRPISTRKYYPGKHAIEIQVNGRSMGPWEFELMEE